MKQCAAVLLALILALGLIGCGRPDTLEKTGGTSMSVEWKAAVSYANWSEDASIFFGALNRDKMAVSSVQHLPIYRMDTAEDLEQFMDAYDGIFSFDQSYDEMPSFHDVAARYDEAFFEEGTLLIVYVSANGGTYRFDVSEVARDGESLCVRVEQTNDPEAVTEDMAGWLAVVAVPDSALAGCTTFDAGLYRSEP